MSRIAVCRTIQSLILTTVALAATGNRGDCQQPQPAKAAAGASEATRRRLESILKNMPTNSDQRCVGIAGAAEALLEGLAAERPEQAAPPDDTPPDGETLARLAEAIYNRFRTEQPLAIPSQVALDGQRRAIDQAEVLRRLATELANLYKENHHRLAESPQGVERLLAAQRSHVRSLEELDRHLAADADQVDFYCCFGVRRFPDGTLRDTSHAVLVCRTAEGKPAVYDPNDPGVPQQCTWEATAEGLAVEWTCRYRNTGQITTQRYFLVPKGRFFRTAFGGDGAATPADDEAPGRQ